MIRSLSYMIRLTINITLDYWISARGEIGTLCWVVSSTTSVARHALKVLLNGL